jgi:hypothetical protein
MLRTLVIIISVYLVPEAIFMIYFISKSMGLFVVLGSLIPYLIAVFTLLFFVITGIRNLIKDSRFNIRLLEIALLIQAFQILLFGFSYANYCGPYIGFGFSNENGFSLVTKFAILEYHYEMGFRKGSSEISISINLFFFILFLIVRRLKKKACKVDGFSFE